MKALTKWWMVGFVALALVGSACGDDEEAGTDGGTTDGGVTDTGTPDGSTPDGSTTDAATDTGAGDDGGDAGLPPYETMDPCTFAPPEGEEPDACAACTATMCGSQFEACDSDLNCCNLVICGIYYGCTADDPQCTIDQCGDYGMGIPAGLALAGCVDTNCAEECN